MSAAPRETADLIARAKAVLGETCLADFSQKATPIIEELIAALRETPAAVPLATKVQAWQQKYEAHHLNPSDDTQRELNAAEGVLFAWTPPAVPSPEMPAIEVGDDVTIEDAAGQRFSHWVETTHDQAVPEGYKAVRIRRVIWRRP